MEAVWLAEGAVRGIRSQAELKANYVSPTWTDSFLESFVSASVKWDLEFPPHGP